MANGCTNILTFVSDKKGIAHILSMMLRNAIVTNWIDEATISPSILDCRDFDESIKLLRETLRCNPSYLDILNPNHVSQEYSNGGWLKVEQIDDNIYLLSIDFSTKWGPSLDPIDDLLDKSGSYLMNESTRNEGASSSTNTQYIFTEDDWGSPFVPDKADLEFGYSGIYCAYCRLFTNSKPKPNGFRLSGLINSNSGKQLLEHKELLSELIRNNEITLRPPQLFKSGKYESWAIAVVVLNGLNGYEPKDLPKDLAVLCEKNERFALSVVINGYSWTIEAATQCINQLKRIDSRLSQDTISVLNEGIQKTSDINKRILETKKIEEMMKKENEEERASHLRKLAEAAIRKDGVLEVLDGDIIPENAFRGMSGIKEVHLNVSVVGKRAFADCPDLLGITIDCKSSDGEIDMLRIEDRAFEKCPYLKEVSCEGTFKWDTLFIGSNIINNCPELEEFKLINQGTGNCDIKKNALGKAPNLRIVELRNITVPKDVFIGCPNIEVLHLTKKAELIEGALNGVHKGLQITGRTVFNHMLDDLV